MKDTAIFTYATREGKDLTVRFCGGVFEFEIEGLGTFDGSANAQSIDLTALDTMNLATFLQHCLGAQDGAQCPKNAAYKTNNGLQEADKT
ncbi:MAG TPA: hypothetical protein VGE47_03750 [Burkholderiaceae bacterium]